MPVAFNVALKLAILASGLKQTAIAESAGLTPWRLSRIINGNTTATKDERKAIARTLKKRPHELFTEAAA